MSTLPWRVVHTSLHGGCIETAAGATVAASLARADADLIVSSVNRAPHLAAIVDRLAVQIEELEARLRHRL